MFVVGIPITDDLRTKFAAEYLRLNRDAYKAGASVWPSEPNRGLMLGMELIKDEKVQAIIDELLSTKGPRAFLASKEEAAAKIYDFATTSERNIPAKERLMAFQLFCRVMGYIEAPGTNVNINQTNNKVMVVQNHGTDEEWEYQLEAQQLKLTSDAA